MKIKVHEPEPEAEPTITLRLEQDGDDGAALIAIDEEGDETCLFRIIPQGLELYTRLPEELGFKLDSQGRLAIV